LREPASARMTSLLCRSLALVVALACAGSFALPARAQPVTPANANTVVQTRRYSPLELERIKRALIRVRGALDEKPEGKRLESIEVVSLPVFEPEDPVPQFLNWFHVTTQDYVIEREVLMRVGSRYDQRLSDETERNLRALLLFSVVVALPVQGSTPDRVRYVVVTKDIWSLRLGWNGRFNQGVLDYLSLQPTESNLFGTSRQLFGTLEFGRRTYSVGAGFYEPRLAGSRTRIQVKASAVVNCDSGEVEGSAGLFQYSRPLYSTRTPWSYSTAVSWTDGQSPFNVTGNLRGSICSIKSEDELAVTLRSGKTGLLPNVYSYDSQGFAQTFTRSYGYRFKTNLSFGLEAARLAYGGADLSSVRAGPSDVPGELTESERLAVERYYRQTLLPVGDTRISPFFQIASFTTDYQRDINSETLGLQEDTSMGHVALLRVYPALQDLGSTRNMLGLDAIATYAQPVGSGYVKGYVAHSVELSTPEQTDAQLSLRFRFTSPRVPFGRVVYDAILVDHYRNYRNINLGLGGTTRLRGYQNTAAVGSHYLASNIEFRTRPLELFSTQLAGVLFYDMGDAFDSFGQIELKHGVGAGIRFLAPQLDRDVFRLDVGVPVPFDAPGGETTVIATFKQAFLPP
jgi:Omp85 superfamily domain